MNDNDGVPLLFLSWEEWDRVFIGHAFFLRFDLTESRI